MKMNGAWGSYARTWDIERSCWRTTRESELLINKEPSVHDPSCYFKSIYACENRSVTMYIMHFWKLLFWMFSNVSHYFVCTYSIQILQDHVNEMWFLQFSHNGRYMASASKDYFIWLYVLSFISLFVIFRFCKSMSMKCGFCNSLIMEGIWRQHQKIAQL